MTKAEFRIAAIDRFFETTDNMERAMLDALIDWYYYQDADTPLKGEAK